LEIKNQVAEDKQQMEEQLSQLEENSLFKEVQAQLNQLRQTRRKEQRSALLQSDSNKVFRLEAEIKGLEEFFNILDGFQKKLDKLSKGAPTDFTY